MRITGDCISKPALLRENIASCWRAENDADHRDVEAPVGLCREKGCCKLTSQPRPVQREQSFDRRVSVSKVTLRTLLGVYRQRSFCRLLRMICNVPVLVYFVLLVSMFYVLAVGTIQPTSAAAVYGIVDT